MGGKFSSTNQPKKRRSGQTHKQAFEAALLQCGHEKGKFYKLLMQMALEGDSTALKFVCSHMVPIPKPTLPVIELDIPEGLTRTKISEYIMQNVFNGTISADHGQLLINNLATIAKIEEADELKKDVEELKERLGVKNE